MSREEIMVRAKDALHNHLNEEQQRISTEFLQKLIALGLDEERALDRLAFTCESFLKRPITQYQLENEDETTVWNTYTKLMLECTSAPGKHRIDAYKLKRIAGRIKKEYGGIVHGDEESYLEFLGFFEKFFYNYYLSYMINSNDVRTIAGMLFYRISGFLKDETYDFTDVAGEDLISMVDMVEYTLYADVIVEQEHKDIAMVKSLIENSQKNKDMIITYLKALIRISESIDVWEKRFGSDGYLKYLEDTFGGGPVFDI